jgi:N-methylhydantoinase A/acetophenone carboxylase
MARAAGLRKIVVTPFSAVFSAFSASNMDVGHRYDSRVDLPLEESSDFSALDRAVRSMEKKAMRDMRGEGFAPDQVELGLELFVRAEEDGPEARLDTAADFYLQPGGIRKAISKARELLAGNGEGSQGLTITMACLIARANVARYEMPEVPPAAVGMEEARKGSRDLLLDEEEGERPTPVYDRSLLTNGHDLAGPALIESEQTTLLIPPGWRMRVDRYNNVVIEEGSGG